MRPAVYTFEQRRDRPLKMQAAGLHDFGDFDVSGGDGDGGGGRWDGDYCGGGGDVNDVEGHRRVYSMKMTSDYQR